MPGIIINPIPTYDWVDGISGDWGNPENWSGDVVPDAQSNAVIAGLQADTITVSQDESVNVLTLDNPNAILVVANDQTLSVYGGIVDTAADALELSGGTLLLGGGSSTLDNETIDLTNSAEITTDTAYLLGSVLTFGSNVNVDSGQGLILAGLVAGDGIVNQGGIAITGTLGLDAFSVSNENVIDGPGSLGVTTDGGSASTADAFVNSGQINNGSLDIKTDNFTNTGLGAITTGIFYDATSNFTNVGTITVTGNSEPGLQNEINVSSLPAAAGIFVNAGTININPGVAFSIAFDGNTTGANYGTISIGAGGNLILDGSLNGSGDIVINTGAVLELAGGELANTLGFAGAGTFQIDQLNSFAGTLADLNVGDVIDFAHLQLTGGSYDDDSVTVTYKGGQETLSLANPLPDGDTFGIGPDKNGGTDLIVQPLCFLSGTMIRTPHGEAAVETLKRGDLVVTSDGRAFPVAWIGRRRVARQFGDPLHILPIRIKAGALDDGLPARDLLLSPDHAILVDGVLVHAAALVNGTSILRETNLPETFTYYHVELDDHALVLAESVPAETFVDNADRLAFDNWAEHEALFPDGKDIVEMPYPRAKSHRQVPRAIRARIAERCVMGPGEAVAAA